MIAIVIQGVGLNPFLSPFPPFFLTILGKERKERKLKLMKPFTVAAFPFLSQLQPFLSFPRMVKKKGGKGERKGFRPTP